MSEETKNTLEIGYNNGKDDFKKKVIRLLEDRMEEAYGDMKMKLIILKQDIIDLK